MQNSILTIILLIFLINHALARSSSSSSRGSSSSRSSSSSRASSSRSGSSSSRGSSSSSSGSFSGSFFGWLFGRSSSHSGSVYSSSSSGDSYGSYGSENDGYSNNYGQNHYVQPVEREGYPKLDTSMDIFEEILKIEDVYRNENKSEAEKIYYISFSLRILPDKYSLLLRPSFDYRFNNNGTFEAAANSTHELQEQSKSLKNEGDFMDRAKFDLTYTHINFLQLNWTIDKNRQDNFTPDLAEQESLKKYQTQTNFMFGTLGIFENVHTMTMKLDGWKNLRNMIHSRPIYFSKNEASLNPNSSTFWHQKRQYSFKNNTITTRRKPNCSLEYDKFLVKFNAQIPMKDLMSEGGLKETQRDILKAKSEHNSEPSTVYWQCTGEQSCCEIECCEKS